MTLLSTTTLSGASTTISSISQSYNTLYMVIRDYLPTDDGRDLRMRINGDSTASRHTVINTFGSSSNLGFGADHITIFIAPDNGTTQSLLRAEFPLYTNSTTWKFARIISIANHSSTTTNFNFVNHIGLYNQTSAISSLSFFSASGNMTSGTVLLYGVK
jgi:hypothetical protein